MPHAGCTTKHGIGQPVLAWHITKISKTNFIGYKWETLEVWGFSNNQTRLQIKKIGIDF